MIPSERYWIKNDAGSISIIDSADDQKLCICANQNDAQRVIESMNKTDMPDALEFLFDKQKALSKDIMNRTDKYPNEIPGRINVLCTAIIHEVIELQVLTDWKWWKKPAEFEYVKAVGELVDVWHFVIQASIELQLTPDELVKEYVKKNDVNHKRQDQNY